jgi:hypothetical protein
MVKFNPLLIKAKEIGLLKDSGSPIVTPELFWCNEWYDSINDKQIIQDGSTCCFLHKIGLPRRFGKRHPLYSWQTDFLTDLNTKKRKFFLLKPPKIGATYLLLYWALHQALTNDTWQNGQVAIVVGTSGLNEAQKMIERAKSLLAIKDKNGNLVLHNGTPQYHYPLTFYNTKTEFTINTVNFRAFPAANSHINNIRSQPNMKLIIGDEVAFFTAVNQDEIRDAFEHYSLGGDAKVVLLTTAGFAPQGFAYGIWQEEPSTYHKTVLDYHAGLEIHPESHTSLYDPTEIETERLQRSFKRNYMHIWGFGEGSIFDSETLEEITKSYELGDILQYPNGLFIDPAYGVVRTKTSSKFGMLVLYKQDNMIRVRDAIELDEPSDEEANAKIRSTIKRYGLKLLGIDGHWTGIANTFKDEINVKRYQFGDIGLEMTDNAADVVANKSVEIHPKFNVLLEELRGAVRGDNGQVDKKKIRYDLGDCFNMGMYEFGNKIEFGFFA